MGKGIKSKEAAESEISWGKSCVEIRLRKDVQEGISVKGQRSSSFLPPHRQAVPFPD